jgi:hypothetical protein
MRKRESDQLAGISGICHNLLIACQRGVEADFTNAGHGGTDTLAPENVTIGQDKYGGGTVWRRFLGGIGHRLLTSQQCAFAPKNSPQELLRAAS